MTTVAVPVESVETRALFGDAVRDIDPDSRTATFVAATETGVDTFQGKEFLRMRGGDFERFRKNPVVLDTHDRFTAGAVIGRAEISTVGRKLIAEVEFAETRRADDIWQLVQGGFLRALSVGFRARDVLPLAEGESNGAGKNRIEGPARIIKEWELFEISVVPVPADGEALKRSFFNQDEAGKLLAGIRRLLETDTKRKDETMSDDKAVETPETKPKADDPAMERLAVAPVPENRKLEDLKRDVTAITPRGLEGLAETCIVEGKSLEETRTALIEANAKRMESAGTPEPETETADQKRADSTPDLKDVPDGALLRGLGC